MNLAIIDDIESDRLRMEQLLSDWSSRYNEKVQLFSFESGESLLENIKPGLFSIIFLDLYMNGISGMETARELRRRGYSCQIVFVTSSIEYALQGYEVDAANYLLKPVEAHSLHQALDHCFSRMGICSDSISVISNRAELSIPLKNIIWIEAQRNALLFHTDGGLVKSYMTIDNLSKMLNGYNQFLLCCKGILVNMDRISTVGNDDFIMDNNEHVQIRKRGGNQVKQEYLHYLFSQAQH